MKFRLQNAPKDAVAISADAGTDGPAGLKEWAGRVAAEGTALVYVIDEAGVKLALDLAAAGEATAWEGGRFTADCLQVTAEAESAEEAVKAFGEVFGAKEKDARTAADALLGKLSGKYRQGREGATLLHDVKVGKKDVRAESGEDGLSLFVATDLYLTPPSFSPHVAVHVPLEAAEKAENWREVA